MIAARLQRDTALRAVGSENGFYKVVAPEGVFCLVKAEYIREESAGRGVVMVSSSSGLRIRAGSSVMSVDPLSSDVMALVPDGTAVTILGREGDWLRIAPPVDVYYYVAADYAQPIGADVAASMPSALVAGAPTGSSGGGHDARTHAGEARSPGQPRLLNDPGAPSAAGANASGAVTASDEQVPRDPRSDAGASSTGSPREGDKSSEPSKRTPRYLTTDWQALLESLERQVESELRKPDEQQDLAKLVQRARPLAEQAENDEVAQTARAWVVKLERQNADLRKRLQEANSVTPFDAVGRLTPAYDVSVGECGLRYALREPSTDKVTVYVEFPPDMGEHVRAALHTYVGVRGMLVKDEAVNVQRKLLRASRITLLRPTGRAERAAP
jgi:hypothetical protein